MNGEDPAYLSIISWPASMDRAQSAAALAESAGLDRFVADQRVARGVPSVVQRLPSSRAREAVKALRAKGVGCFALAQSQIESAPKALLAKSLSEALGAPEPMYMVEPWRGEPCGFLAKNIFLIVRARIRVRETERAEPSGGVLNSHPRGGAGGFASPGMGIGGGIIGMGMYAASEMDAGTTSGPVTRTRTTEVLDLYLRDNSKIRINGDKFNFDVLGAERGYSDNESMDKLALRLAEQAPGALIDAKFDQFVCPGAFLKNLRVSSNGKEVRNDMSLFDFYSVWLWLFNRLLARR
jgi:hypothetical protein